MSDAQLYSTLDKILLLTLTFTALTVSAPLISKWAPRRIGKVLLVIAAAALSWLVRGLLVPSADFSMVFVATLVALLAGGWVTRQKAPHSAQDRV